MQSVLQRTAVMRGSYKKKIDYAIYNNDEFLFLGKSDECAKFLDCSESTFRFYLTESYKKRVAKRKNARNYIVVIKVEDDVD